MDTHAKETPSPSEITQSKEFVLFVTFKGGDAEQIRAISLDAQHFPAAVQGVSAFLCPRCLMNVGIERRAIKHPRGGCVSFSPTRNWESATHFPNTFLDFEPDYLSDPYDERQLAPWTIDQVLTLKRRLEKISGPIICASSIDDLLLAKERPHQNSAFFLMNSMTESFEDIFSERMFTGSRKIFTDLVHPGYSANPGATEHSIPLISDVEIQLPIDPRSTEIALSITKQLEASKLRQVRIYALGQIKENAHYRPFEYIRIRELRKFAWRPLNRYS